MNDSLLKNKWGIDTEKRDPGVRETPVCLRCGNRWNNTLEKARVPQYEKLSAMNNNLNLK